MGALLIMGVLYFVSTDKRQRISRARSHRMSNIVAELCDLVDCIGADPIGLSGIYLKYTCCASDPAYQASLANDPMLRHDYDMIEWVCRGYHQYKFCFKEPQAWALPQCAAVSNTHSTLHAFGLAWFEHFPPNRLPFIGGRRMHYQDCVNAIIPPSRDDRDAFYTFLEERDFVHVPA